MSITNRAMFTPILKPLLKPEYVLRMAMSKGTWQWRAQRKHLLLMREALVESLEETNEMLARMPHPFIEDLANGLCEICGWGRAGGHHDIEYDNP